MRHFLMPRFVRWSHFFIVVKPGLQNCRRVNAVYVLHNSPHSTAYMYIVTEGQRESSRLLCRSTHTAKQKIPHICPDLVLIQLCLGGTRF